MTGGTPKGLDEIVDAVLAYRGEISSAEPAWSPAAWGIPVEQILSDKELRLDAAHFDLAIERRLSDLKAAGIAFLTLREITASVFMPPQRQSRKYVEDEEYGVPFLQGGQITSFRPVGMKTISRDWKNFDSFIINAGWLLLTRSGTIGSVAICPDEWDGWAASEHVFRILPDAEKCPPGYLYCCLVSDVVQMQLSAQAYGGQVDELTEEHIRDLQIPFLNEAVRDDINRTVLRAMQARSKAAALLNRSAVRLSQALVDHD